MSRESPEKEIGRQMNKNSTSTSRPSCIKKPSQFNNPILVFQSHRLEILIINSSSNPNPPLISACQDPAPPWRPGRKHSIQTSNRQASTTTRPNLQASQTTTTPYPQPGRRRPPPTATRPRTARQDGQERYVPRSPPVLNLRPPPLGVVVPVLPKNPL